MYYLILGLFFRRFVAYYFIEYHNTYYSNLSSDVIQVYMQTINQENIHYVIHSKVFHPIIHTSIS